MRRLFISPAIKAYAEEYAKTLSVEDYLVKLKSLKDKLIKKHTGKPYAEYVQYIIKKHEEILKLEPDGFENYRLNNLNMVLFEDLEKPVPGFEKIDGIKSIKFHRLIVEAMRYDDVRKKYFLPYVKRLGIKTCVYCNAQYAITTDENNGNFATYETDHYFPKSKYPFLCISLFNLQPSCGRCNGSKGQKTANFSMYTTKHDDLYPFIFQLDKRDIARYMVSHDPEELKLKLSVINSDLESKNLLKNHQDIFHIDNLYTEHKDIAEEVIWKAKIYNSTYRQQLSSTFERLFPHGMRDFPRFLLGSYTRKEDVHKRPLTKLMQDIARDMGLLE